MNATLTASSPTTHAAGNSSTPLPSQWMRWPLLRCLALYRHTPWRFGLTLLLYAAINLGLALQQWLLGRAVNEVQLGQGVLVGANGELDMRPVLLSLALLAAVAFGRAVLQYTAAIVGLVIQQRLLSTLREAIFEQVQTLHLAYHWQHGAGELITRTTRDADKVRDALTSFWRQGIDSLFVVMASMGYLFWYHASLGIVPLILTLVALVLLLQQADALVELDRVVGDAYDQVNQDLTEGVHGVRVIKSFNLEADRVTRFRAQVQRFVNLGEAALAYASIRIPLPQMLVGFGQVWVLGWGLHLVVEGRLNSGELVAALLMVNLLVLRIEGIGRVIKTYADARSSAARIWDLLDARSSIVGGSAPFPDHAVGVRLQGVRVLPPGGGHPVLDEVSLDIAPGEIVGLVGATGSGKTTVASLFPRLVDPSDGEVLVGLHGAWRDIKEFDLSTLRRRVQVVPQECFLFSDSLADNLRLAAPEASDAELFEALRIACADDFVRSLPEGLHSKFGDRGVTLSGGQRQRLCIARALLARPAVLVLDDATSALDTLTERSILDHLRAQATHANDAPAVLMISNRRASLALADRVLLLQAGRIQAHGTQSELSKNNASYRALMGIPADGH